MGCPEVALGFTNTIDLEMIWDEKHFERLAAQAALTAAQIADHNKITSIEELLGSVLFHFSNGTGCGLYVEDPALLDQVLCGSAYHTALGGTAVRAALVLDRLGCLSLVHLVSHNDHTLRLLPPSVSWVCSRKDQSFYPHVTIQFPKGATVCVDGKTLAAPRANRVVYTGDLDNSQLRIAPDFFSRGHACKVMVLSSFDLIQDTRVLENRLRDVRKGLESLAAGTWLFYEDAHFAHADFPEIIWRYLLPYIHIYSMNEDEFFRYIGRTPDLLCAQDILSGLEYLHQKIPVPCLVIHTRCWALAYGPYAQQARSGIDAGVVVASTRYRLGDAWGPEDLAETRELPCQPEAVQFADALSSLSSVPVSIRPCYQMHIRNATTIGLGDSFVGGFVDSLRHERLAVN